MNLDTNIALGVRPPPIDFNSMNQGNVLANMAQLRSADNQNALAQYQLASAKRGDESQAALMKDAQDPNFKMTFANAIKYGPLGMTALKAQQDAETQALTRTETQGKIDTGAYALQKKKLDNAIQIITNLNTPEEAIASVNESLANKNIDQSRASQLIKDIQTKPFAQFKAEQLKGLTTAAEQITNATSIANNAANNATSVANNANTVTATTRGQDMTDLRAKQAQAFLERKFAYEQANPTKTYHEGADGYGFAFNGKNGQLTPAMNAPLGGSNAMAPAAGPSTNALAAPAPAQGPAPSAAPVARPPAAAGTAGPMGITLPANGAQPAAPATPAAVNAPGTQFVGKGTQMTEAQSNAALYGGAMAQSHSTMQELAKRGTITPNMGADTLKLIGSLAPKFIGEGVNYDAAVDAIFRKIPLLGMDSDQSRLAQAQISFAVAWLRKTSGAAFGGSEILSTIKEFFPFQSEDKAVIDQKSNARERAIEGMKISTSNEGKKYISNYQNLAPASNAVTHPNHPGFSISK